MFDKICVLLKVLWLYLMAKQPHTGTNSQEQPYSIMFGGTYIFLIYSNIPNMWILEIIHHTHLIEIVCMCIWVLYVCNWVHECSYLQNSLWK